MKKITDIAMTITAIITAMNIKKTIMAMATNIKKEKNAVTTKKNTTHTLILTVMKIITTVTAITAIAIKEEILMTKN